MIQALHKALVYLEYVEGELEQVGKRRIAGSKIVRGWNGTLSGTAALAVLLALIAILGKALRRVPLHTL